jgi:hypothetical protein
MKGRTITLLVVVLLAALIAWWFTRPDLKSTPKPTTPGLREQAPEPPPPVAEEESKAEKLEKLKEESRKPWLTPITFYGKVVDENAQPVEGAQVEFDWNDLSPAGHSEVRTTSDAWGLFSLTGVQGKRLLVSVKKTGYYTWHERNQGSFEYASKSEDIYHKPDPNNPVLFYLKKKGEAEPLVKIEKYFRIRRDGTPVSVDLLKGKEAPKGQGDLQVECWTADQHKDRFNRYNWRCRITVPNGGLIESTKEFDFEAPENGYRPSDEIEMPMSLAEKWRPEAEKRYFVKLGNGNYARIMFRMIAGGDHFFKIESFLNPSGSRNLEYDKTKDVTAQYK